MRSLDVRATTAGVLFIAATATSLVATALRGSLLNGPGFLAAVALHQDRLLAAALFQLLAAFTSAAIAVTLYRCSGSMPPRQPSGQSPSGSSRVCSTPVRDGHTDPGEPVRPARRQRLHARVG
jgi:Domain of unknown function (DUF4386)